MMVSDDAETNPKGMGDEVSILVLMDDGLWHGMAFGVSQGTWLS